MTKFYCIIARKQLVLCKFKSMNALYVTCRLYLLCETGHHYELIWVYLPVLRIKDVLITVICKHYWCCINDRGILNYKHPVMNIVSLIGFTKQLLSTALLYHTFYHIRMYHVVCTELKMF